MKMEIFFKKITSSFPVSHPVGQTT